MNFYGEGDVNMDFYYLEEINCFAKIFERTNFFRNNYFTDMKFNIFQNQISFLYLYFTNITGSSCLEENLNETKERRHLKKCDEST